VPDKVIVEIKAVEKIPPIYKAQILSYMKLAEKDVGLLINFNVEKLIDGIERFVLYSRELYLSSPKASKRPGAVATRLPKMMTF